MQKLAEACTIHIQTQKYRDTLPSQQNLRRFLADFGRIIAVYEWPSDELRSSRPNNALVVFESSAVAENALACLSRQDPFSFWSRHSLVAHHLRPEFMNHFEKGLLAKKYMNQLGDTASPLAAGPSHSRFTPDRPQTKRPSPPSRDRWSYSEPFRDEPPEKKPRKESPRDDSVTSGYNKASSSKLPLPSDPITAKSYAKSPVPPSSGWMRARIEQLEADLSAANAARDLALSEQLMIAQSLEAEQQARRKALTQKSAAEAALSRAEAEQTRLLEELGRRQQDASLEELRGRIEAAEGTLLEVRNSTEEREALLKTREAELEEARDSAHKLRIRLTEMEQNGPPASALLQDARDEAKNLKTQLEDAQKELEDSQKAANKFSLKYQNEKSKRVATKDKLAEYKSRLRLNNSLSDQLRDTAPAALEGLKAVMEAMGLPPLQDQDQLLTPKAESD